MWALDPVKCNQTKTADTRDDNHVAVLNALLVMSFRTGRTVDAGEGVKVLKTDLAPHLSSRLEP